MLSAVVNVTGRLVSCAELDSRRALTAVFDTSAQRPESPLGGIWDRMQHESPPRPVTTAPRSDQACPAAGRPWEQRTVPGLSFGLIHSRPLPFTGVRVFVFAQATDGGERW